MKVEIEVRGYKAYVCWVRGKHSHIVLDLKEAKIFSLSRARQIKRQFSHKKARLVKVK